ncbi:hypothetical protein BMS3Abin03_02563 [bacterium BMS3Abin03]|nr:hypothetical protein BMS3Abin03_02563 [bacterium BMS3Abin03]
MPATTIKSEAVLNKIFNKKSGQYMAFDLILASRKGISYADYLPFLSEKDFFLLKDWAKILHISERTLQRYKRDKLKFDASLSEKFLQILIILKKGIEVFGNRNKFISWLNTKSIPLGGNKPKDLLDTSFGVNLVSDELTRIAHGVFA